MWGTFLSMTIRVAITILNVALLWRHNGHDCVPNHQPHHCLLNFLFGRRSKKTSKLRVTGLCVGNSPGTGEFPAQMASNAGNVSIWWRHHGARSILIWIYWPNWHFARQRSSRFGRLGFATHSSDHRGDSSVIYPGLWSRRYVTWSRGCNWHKKASILTC